MGPRRRTVLLALVLGLGGLPTLAPTGAVAAGPLPCLEEMVPLGFRTNPPITPSGPSSVYFLFHGGDGGGGGMAPPEQRIVTRPDGTQAHEFTVNGVSGSFGDSWQGTDTFPYTLPNLGTWILHDSDGVPWRRFSAKAASWFTSLVGPDRILTAGESFTVTARVEGWTTTTAVAPVRGMPVGVNAYLPNGWPDWSRSMRTSPTGTVSMSARATSNRSLRTNSAFGGCWTHAGSSAPNLTVQVRKRITATPGTTTPAVGQYVQIRGTIYPARANQPVYLQRWNGTSFETVAPGRTNGDYTFAYRPASRGTHTLRVYTPYDSWHVSSGSPNLHLTVR